jgi:hypothetical protein
MYDGCTVVATGAIMISTNYILGPLGYLALETVGITGNMGIQDIMLGLQWIQDNIAAFIGNPVSILPRPGPSGYYQMQQSAHVNKLVRKKCFCTASLLARLTGSLLQPSPKLRNSSARRLWNRVVVVIFTN